MRDTVLYVVECVLLPYRRVKGLKGKKAWEYERTISDTSLSSVRSPSPTPSPTPSPIPSPIPSPNLSSRLDLASKSDTSILVSAPSIDESNLDFKSASARRYVVVTFHVSFCIELLV